MIILSTHPIEADVMASVRLRHLLRFLSSQKRQVICICPEGTSSSLGDLPGITIRSLHRTTKWSYVLSAASEIARSLQNDSQKIVLSSIPGIQTFIAAVLARRVLRASFKLILEVRDPFSLNPALPWPALKRALGRRMERYLLRDADQAIFLTTAIQSMYFSGFSGQQPWKSRNVVITNGYQMPSKVPEYKVLKLRPLKLTYAGHFYDRRDPSGFLTALRDYLYSHPECPIPSVQIAGEVHGEALSRRVKQICEDPKLQVCVQWLGQIKHDEAVRLMQSSDVNLLFTHDHGSEYAIPGKLFEYMGARRPVLAITRDPLVIQIMKESQLGWICEDQPAITQWFDRFLNDTPAFQNWRPVDRATSAYLLENIHPRWLDFVESRTS